MQVSVETTSRMERKMTVVIPASDIDPAIDAELQKLSEDKSIKLKGFRPGKIPMRAIRSNFGKYVREKVVNDTISAKLQEIFTERKLNPAGRPSVEPLDSNPGEDLEFTVTFEVFPEFDLGDLAKLNIKREQAEITEADIEEAIEKLRQQNGEWLEEAGAAKEGCRVVINFEGRLEGETEPFPGGKADDFGVVIGSGSTIEGFESGLLGKQAGDTCQLNLTFPEDYHGKDVAGKPVTFDITVVKVEAMELPDVDDDFAHRFEEENLEALRAEVRRNLERDLSVAARSRVKNRVMKALLTMHELELPEKAVEEETMKLKMDKLQAMKQQMEQGKMHPGMIDAMAGQDFKEQAERRLKLGLILSKCVEKFGLQLDEALVDAKITESAEMYGTQAEQVAKYLRSDRNRMAEIEAVVMEDQILDEVLKVAQVTDANVSYQDLFGPDEEGEA